MTDALNTESMSSVDRAWLGMDSETNLMIINCVLLFDELITPERFRDVFERRMVGQFARFRQRIVERPPASGRYVWEDDPYFDIRAHLRRMALPAPADTATLQALISEFMSADFDRNKPLWRAYLIEGYGAGCAVFVRFHHCIADGIALIRVMLSLTDNGPAPQPTIETSAPLTPGKNGHRLGPIGALLHATRSAAGGASKVAGLMLRETRHAIDDPERVVEAAKATGIISAASAAVVTRLLVIPPDRASAFRGELGTAKRAVWSDPVPLNEVKRIGKTLGGTVNDVLIAALTGALRAYMGTRSDHPEKGDLRAMVPVNLRPLDQEIELGNQFGLVYLSLPVTIEDPLQRLFEVKRRMDILKSSPEAIVAYQLLNALGIVPGDLATRATDLFASKASAVLTNVPGPQKTLYFAGAPIRRIMFWVPQSGNIGMGLSIISYDGQVTLGIVVDEKLVAHPECILAYFTQEFDLLAQLADQRSAAGLP